jgi:hypothetical protein
MRVLLLIGGLILIVLVAGRIVLRTPPGELARWLKFGGAGVLFALAVFLAFLRQFALALPLAIFAWTIVQRVRRTVRTAPGEQSSSVRSAGLEMRLDLETGEMDGRILAGRHEGRYLSELEFEGLLEVAEDFRGDPESLRLLENYLDRRFPGWRENVEADARERHGPAPGAGSMSTEEAYHILGLDPGAGDAEVRQAHRRLMKQVHPDRGGSAALAAKINEAKDRILARHR